MNIKQLFTALLESPIFKHYIQFTINVHSLTGERSYNFHMQQLLLQQLIILHMIFFSSQQYREEQKPNAIKHIGIRLETPQRNAKVILKTYQTISPRKSKMDYYNT